MNKPNLVSGQPESDSVRIGRGPHLRLQRGTKLPLQNTPKLGRSPHTPIRVAMVCALSAIACGQSASPILAAPAFVDVTTSAQLNFVNVYGPTFVSVSLDMQRNMGNGAAVGDVDNDGDLDVYVLGNAGVANALFRNDLDLGLKSFTDITATAGVGDIGLSRVAQFVDLDNNGWLDLVLLNDNDGLQPTSKIFRNNGDGTFSDETVDSGFGARGYLRCGLAVADYDRDGLLDLYATNWGGEGGHGFTIFLGANVLYRNLDNFLFDNVTATTGLAGLKRDSFTAIFADFNKDGWPDIHVAVDHTSDETYLNVGGSFVNITATVGTTHTGNDMGLACADFDDDDDLDLYSTNITDPTGPFGVTAFNVLYVNQFNSPTSFSFTDEAATHGVEDTYWGWGTVFCDVENDGDLDLLTVGGFDQVVEDVAPTDRVLDAPSVLLVNDSLGNFTRVLAPGLEPGWDSRALIAFDYDRDGDEDFLITNVNEPVRLLENVSTPMGNWLDVTVQQRPGQNRNGIGVIVYATFNGMTKRRDIIIGNSYLSGNPAEIHFGLGSESVVNPLRVVWTDGSESLYANVAANSRIHLVQRVPSNVTVNCGQPTEPADTGQPTIAAGCTPATISFVDSITPGECNAGSEIVRTWTVADACGESFVGIQTITLVGSSNIPAADHLGLLFMIVAVLGAGSVVITRAGRRGADQQS